MTVGSEDNCNLLKVVVAVGRFYCSCLLLMVEGNDTVDGGS
jgi:hypothetical protein